MAKTPSTRRCPARIAAAPLAILWCLALLSAAAPAQKVPWQESLAAAQAESVQRNAPLLVVWTMPQGRGDLEVCEALADKAVAKAMAGVVPLHYRWDPFGCGEPERPRRATEPPAVSMRSADHDGLVAALGLEAEAMPEPALVVLLAPDGNGILHHIGRLQPGELIWMLERAAREVDPEAELPAAGRDGVHAPLAVEFAPVEAWNKVAPPLSTAARAERVEALKRSNFRVDLSNLQDALALLRLDDEGARGLLETLSRGIGGRRGGGGTARLASALRAIAFLGPRGWSDQCLELTDHPEESIQLAAAEALEALADPGVGRQLLALSRRAEAMDLRGMLLRAAAAATPKDRKVAKDVFRTLEKAKDPTLRTHAMLACAHLHDREAVLEAVGTGLGDSDPAVRTAAAFVTARWRDAGPGLALKDAVLAEPEEAVRNAMQAALDAPLGGPLDPFRAFTRKWRIPGMPGAGSLAELGGRRR